MSSQGSVSRARVQRRALTPPEARLWVFLRRRGLGDLKFRRQHPIGPYVLDFYCAEAKLAVEVDGAGHDHPERVEHDRHRTAWLAARGIAVLRLAAEDIRTNLDGVLVAIRTAAEAPMRGQEPLHPSTPSGSPSPFAKRRTGRRLNGKVRSPPSTAIRYVRAPPLDQHHLTKLPTPNPLRHLPLRPLLSPNKRHRPGALPGRVRVHPFPSHGEAPLGTRPEAAAGIGRAGCSPVKTQGVRRVWWPFARRRLSMVGQGRTGSDPSRGKRRPTVPAEEPETRSACAKSTGRSAG
ncbi:hypothetical protein BH10PSE1_BH10PSE1_16380 [soil metagenome]